MATSPAADANSMEVSEAEFGDVGSQAHYSYASMSRFMPIAVRLVTQRFINGARAYGVDVSALRLQYDTSSEIFSLTCPTEQGPALDELLWETIKKTVAEDAAAVQDHGSEPYILPFWEDPMIGFSRANISRSCDTRQRQTQLLQGISSTEPVAHNVTSHVIHPVGMSHDGKLKLVRYKDSRLRSDACTMSCMKANTPAGFVVKSAAYNNHAAAVRVDESSGNQMNDTSFPLVDWISNQLVFKPFVRSNASNRPRDLQPSSGRQWEFAGNRVNVDQWISGMGNIRQVEPDVAPEATNDALQFSAGPSIQHPVVGRARVPAGHRETILASQMPAEEEVGDIEQTEQQRGAAFMASLGREIRNDQNSEASESDSSHNDIIEDGNFMGSRSTLQILGGTEAVSTTSGVDESITPTPMMVASRDIVSRNTSSSQSQPNSRSQTAPSVVVSNASNPSPIPVYDKSYAKIDGYGLIGSAAAQAQYEAEHSTPARFTRSQRRSQVSESPSSLSGSRPAKTTLGNNAVASTLSSNRLGMTNSKLSLSGSITPQSYDTTILGGSEPWADNVVKPTDLEVAALVDISVPEMNQSQFPPLAPPGQARPQRSLVVSRSMQDYSVRAAETAAPLSPPHPEIKLIDLSDVEQNTGQAVVRPPPGFGMSLMPARTPSARPLEHSQGSRNTNQEANEIQERLAKEFHDLGPLWRTMNQQAGKKNKSKGGKGNKQHPNQSPGKVELPLPDLPQPRITKKKKDITTDSGSQVDTIASKTTDPDLLPAVETRAIAASDDPFSETTGTSLQHRLDALLADFNEETNTPAMLEVHFGIALLRVMDPLVGKELGCDELEASLAGVGSSDTTFLRQAVRNIHDATRLFTMPLPISLEQDSPLTSLLSAYEGGWLEGSTQYSIDIQDRIGRALNVTFPDADPVSFSVQLTLEGGKMLFVHFPMAKLDARVTLSNQSMRQKDESALWHSIREFISSFCTSGDVGRMWDAEGLPEFEAVVPQYRNGPAFDVKAFRYKRDFFMNVSMFADNEVAVKHPDSEGVRWTVSEVWDLYVEKLSPRTSVLASESDSNLIVFATPREQMIADNRWWREATLSLLTNPPGTTSAVQSNYLQKVIQTLVKEMEHLEDGDEKDTNKSQDQASQKEGESKKKKTKKKSQRDVNQPFW